MLAPARAAAVALAILVRPGVISAAATTSTVEGVSQSSVTAGSVDALIREGRDAYRRGDASLSYRSFQRAAEERASGEVLEGLAKSLHLALDYPGAMEAYERAYAAYHREGDLLGAARAARTVGWFRGSIYGDWVVYSGWIGRARSLLETAGEASNEHGWILVAEAQRGSELQEQKRLYLSAIDKARSCGDSDLECEALASLGIMLVFSGFPDGLVHLDEALTTVCAGEVEDLSVIESVLCGLFYACERTNDVVRAEQWLRAVDDLTRRRKLAAVGGYCRAYYGGILTAAGRWLEAEAELTAALRTFPAYCVQVRGNVLCRLGEVALAQDLLQRTLDREVLEDAVEGPLLACSLTSSSPPAKSTRPSARSTDSGPRWQPLREVPPRSRLHGDREAMSRNRCWGCSRLPARGAVHVRAGAAASRGCANPARACQGAGDNEPNGCHRTRQ